MTPQSLEWYRLDRVDGTVKRVSRERVDAQASTYYSDCSPDGDLDGRFSTPFAIYIRADRVSETDRVAFDFPLERIV